MRSYENPVETEERTSSGVETKITHPAFAQIGASRVQGSVNLYGTELHHQHFMTVTIRRSTLRRAHSGEQPTVLPKERHRSTPLLQRATFISTPNSGFGVACTIQNIERKSVPQLPPPTKTQSERFEKDINEHLEKALEGLARLEKDLEGPLSKTKVAELKNRAMILRTHLQSNTAFVGTRFVEHMEDVVEKAKIEVSAYATAAVQRAGLASLVEKNEKAPIVTLLMPEKKDP